MAPKRDHTGDDLIRKRNSVVASIKKQEQRSRVHGGGCASNDPNDMPKAVRPVKNAPNLYDGKKNPYTGKVR